MVMVSASRETVNGTTTYVQDVQAPLPVVLAEATGGQTSLYLYGNDLLAQFSPTGDPSYYHTDGLGSGPSAFQRWDWTAVRSVRL